MGDPRRFQAYAKYLSSQFPPDKYPVVADIASGKGELSRELIKFGYSVTSFDKTKIKSPNHKRKYFTTDIKDKFDLLVGMHPDEATDIIVIRAIKRSVAFSVCPCCILPFLSSFKDIPSDKNWHNHLKKLALSKNYKIIEANLPIKGKNWVLSGKPKYRAVG